MCIYICLRVYRWLCTLYDGLSWLRKQPSLVMRALDLQVWVCAQGECRMCIIMLYYVHDHHSVIVLIHVTKRHWFPRVMQLASTCLMLWRPSASRSMSMSIRIVYTNTKPSWCAITHQTWNFARFSPWNGASPMPYSHVEILVRIAFGVLWRIWGKALSNFCHENKAKYCQIFTVEIW